MSTGSLHTDWFITTGSTHDICQDYVLTGKYGDYAYGIVADGCSSSPRSEIGAKLLCLSAEALIREQQPRTLFSLSPVEFGNLVITRARLIRSAIGAPCSLDATLGIVISD